MQKIASNLDNFCKGHMTQKNISSQGLQLNEIHTIYLIWFDLCVFEIFDLLWFFVLFCWSRSHCIPWTLEFYPDSSWFFRFLRLQRGMNQLMVGAILHPLELHSTSLKLSKICNWHESLKTRMHKTASNLYNLCKHYLCYMTRKYVLDDPDVNTSYQPK